MANPVNNSSYSSNNPLPGDNDEKLERLIILAREAIQKEREALRNSQRTIRKVEDMEIDDGKAAVQVKRRPVPLKDPGLSSKTREKIAAALRFISEQQEEERRGSTSSNRHTT